MGFQRLGAVERGWLDQLKALKTENDSCRWIEDNPKAEHPHCGAETKPGSSYCEEHHARAYSNRPLKPITIPKNAY
ncbi:MAG: GcrA family cell cycle regulator [Kiloniellales bacterium]|nr:GcrA family cell cycle regulator [Kiloniellales bacterium]